MKNIQTYADKMAMSLSLICSIHCLALPVILALLPGLITLQINNEKFHFWMIVAVIPTSIYALTMGCKQHSRYQFFFVGTIGLICLFISAILGEFILGERWEKNITCIGTALIAYSHYNNYRLCQSEKSYSCAGHSNANL